MLSLSDIPVTHAMQGMLATLFPPVLGLLDSSDSDIALAAVPLLGSYINKLKLGLKRTNNVMPEVCLTFAGPEPGTMWGSGVVPSSQRSPRLLHRYKQFVCSASSCTLCRHAQGCRWQSSPTADQSDWSLAAALLTLASAQSAPDNNCLLCRLSGSICRPSCKPL